MTMTGTDTETDWGQNRGRDRDHDRDRDRRYDHDRWGDRGSQERDSHRSRYSVRDKGRQYYKRSGRDSDRRMDSSSCRSRSRSWSVQIHGTNSDRHPSPFGDGNRDKITTAFSNLAKLKDLYGDASDEKGDTGKDRLRKDSSTEEVIRLGGSTWN